MDKKIIDTENLLNIIIKSIHEKKGENPVSLNIDKLDSSICDYFVICNAQTGIQVNSIADNIEFNVKKEFNIFPKHKEGQENAQWVLIDFGDIVVHVFENQYREFYKLEELWADAPMKSYDASEGKMLQ